ncbi:MAG: hypothetical protein IJS59_04090 [Bacteroidaceae bacterium]|nr:hypothetical protein [Bacteroidaceae bacterium]
MLTSDNTLLHDMQTEAQELELQIQADNTMIAGLQSDIDSWESLISLHRQARRTLEEWQRGMLSQCEQALVATHLEAWSECYHGLDFSILVEQMSSLTGSEREKLCRIEALGKSDLATFAETMERDWLKPDDQQQYPHNFPFAIQLDDDALAKEALKRLPLTKATPEPCSTYAGDQLFVMLGSPDVDSVAGTYSETCRRLVSGLMAYGPLMPAYSIRADEMKEELRSTLDGYERRCADLAKENIGECRSKLELCQFRLTTLSNRLDAIRHDITARMDSEAQADPITRLPEHADDYGPIIEHIAEAAERRYILRELTCERSGSLYTATWQDADTPASNNLYAPGPDESGAWSTELRNASVNALLLRTVLAFPIGMVHIAVIDLQMTGFFSLLLNRFDASLAENIINPTALTQLIERLEQQVAYAAAITSNVLHYNPHHEELLTPYQLVVICGCQRQMLDNRNIATRLLQLMEVGHRYGIHFIALDDLCTDTQLAPLFSPYTDLAPHTFPQPYIDYINAGVHKARTHSTLQPTWQSGQAFATKPQPVDDAIAIPYGEYGMKQEAVCMFDDATPQAILIGQTGSGKSYFMHTLLLNAMLRYSASCLELYLMDFKLGAPELARYRDYPHVSHLMADGSDRKVVYEVLRGLYERMSRRGKLIAERGCRGIRDYNASLAPGEAPMRRILLVVDECHNLFQADAMERQLQERITAVMERIAAEGRSQGVHFLLGTQTLANTQIPQNVINNISNRFLMQCSDIDAERLVDHGAQKVQTLTQGMVYSRQADKVARIYDYAPYAQAAREAICANNERPADAHTFFFSGKLTYPYAPNEELMRQSRHATVQIGKGVAVAQTDVTVRLKRDLGQNILITGINEQMQAERVLTAVVRSFHDCCMLRNKPFTITLIDNLDDDDDLYNQRTPILDMLEARYDVHIVSGRARKTAIERIADEVRHGDTGHTQLLAILGKERMRRLLSESIGATPTAQTPTPAKGFGYARFAPKPATDASDMPFRLVGTAATADTQPHMPQPATTRHTTTQTVDDALRDILLHGPEAGIFTVMQAARPASVMLDEHATRQALQQLFCHIVMLQMPDRDAASRLPLPTDISLERLPADNDRLRAYYYNDERGTAELFIPYTTD